LSLILVLVGLLLAYVGWKSSAPIRAGGWRVGAGLLALLLVVVGIILALRGDEWVGLPVTAAGLVMALLGRSKRGARQRDKASMATQAEAMSVVEARSILGVDEDADPERIKAAYMRLMKRNHPDQGGTSGLASKLNAARDRLLAGR
jgi:hypothetical protein